MINEVRLNLGAGKDVRDGFINVDIAALPGIDVVCDLNEGIPFARNSVDEIVAINVLEHLPDTLKTMEELWRISKDGSNVRLRVPYWNCSHAFRDPTHRAWFHEESFNFYDPETPEGRRRDYYTVARFRMRRVDYWIAVSLRGRERYLLVKNRVLKGILGFLARYFCNIIILLEVELETLK